MKSNNPYTVIMANINNTNDNQEATVSFDPWANHSDAELDAMAEAYAEREHVAWTST